MCINLWTLKLQVQILKKLCRKSESSTHSVWISILFMKFLKSLFANSVLSFWFIRYPLLYILDVFLKPFFLFFCHLCFLVVCFYLHSSLFRIVNVYFTSLIFFDGSLVLEICENGARHLLIMWLLALSTEYLLTHKAIQNFVTHFVKAVLGLRDTILVWRLIPVIMWNFNSWMMV